MRREACKIKGLSGFQPVTSQNQITAINFQCASLPSKTSLQRELSFSGDVVVAAVFVLAWWTVALKWQIISLEKEFKRSTFVILTLLQHCYWSCFQRQEIVCIIIDLLHPWLLHKLRMMWCKLFPFQVIPPFTIVASQHFDVADIKDLPYILYLQSV